MFVFIHYNINNNWHIYTLSKVLNIYKKPKLYNNRYNVLANFDDNVETNDVHKSSSQEPTDTTAYTFVKEILSPPIFIKGVKNVTEIFIEFTNLIGRNSFVWKSSSTHLKIQTEKPEDYRILIRYANITGNETTHSNFFKYL